MPSKRSSYSLQFKLHVISEYKFNVKGCGFNALAKKYELTSPSLVRDWHRNREKLHAASKDRQVATRTVRRLPGAGRNPQHQQLEKDLHEWIIERNNKGLRVKDKYIQLQALNLHSKLVVVDSDKQPDPFKASSGWLDRFKTRYNLVSRRQTTTRTLPVDAAAICLAFINEAQALIEKHNIQPCNVINMDQVPRYFETEPKTTITTKGSREVLLRKGGTSHKRFTATFSITGDGQILTPHLLFSMLKKKPVCPPGVMVDVNNSGMWSDEILLEHAKQVICGRQETKFYRQHVLYIIDFYAAHVKMFDEQRLRNYNVHVLLVPPNLTSLCQPLDVAVSRSFQEFYRDKYDTYIAQALCDSALQTPAGNPKVPKYFKVAEWVLEWAASKTSEEISHAFELCGLVRRSAFSMEMLHPPLRQLISGEISMDEWHQRYQALVSNVDDREELCIANPAWYIPEDIRRSLFFCLQHGIGADTPDYVASLIQYMKTLEDLDGLFDEAYLKALQDGEIPGGELELFAAVRKHRCNIEVKTLDEDCRVVEAFAYSVDDPVKTICMARIGHYYFLEVNGFHL